MCLYMSVNRQGGGGECAHVYEYKQVGGGGSVCMYMSVNRGGGECVHVYECKQGGGGGGVCACI